MDNVSILIEFLKSQRMITPLEKDILDTWNEYQKNEQQMNDNNNVSNLNENVTDFCSKSDF